MGNYREDFLGNYSGRLGECDFFFWGGGGGDQSSFGSLNSA